MACDDGPGSGWAAEGCFRGILAPPFCHRRRRRRSLIRRSRPPRRESFQNALRTWTCPNGGKGTGSSCPLAIFFVFTLCSFPISKGTASPCRRNRVTVTGGDLDVRCNIRRSVCTYTAHSCVHPIRVRFYTSETRKPYLRPCPRFQRRGPPAWETGCLIQNHRFASFDLIATFCV